MNAVSRTWLTGRHQELRTTTYRRKSQTSETPDIPIRQLALESANYCWESHLASTPAVDRDLVVEGPRTAACADGMGLCWCGRPFLIRLPEFAGGGSP